MGPMMTNRISRKQAAATITADVAQHGHAGRDSVEAFMSSGLSRHAYEAAVKAGLEQHDREAGAGLFVSALLLAVAR